MIKRIIFYSVFVGYVIGFFGHLTMNPILQALNRGDMCVVGPGVKRSLVALLGAGPSNGLICGVLGTIVAVILYFDRRNREREHDELLRTSQSR